MKKIYIPVMAAMLATPLNSVANAEELPKTETTLEEVIVEPVGTGEEVIEVEGNVEEWLEDAIEQEPEEEVIQEGYENLGPMIFKSSAISSKIAANDKGEYFIYYIMHGAPAALVVVDYQTKETIHTFTLEDSKSAWGLDVDENGKLWVGGSVSSVLYSYDPNTEVFENHGAIFSNKSDTSIQDLIVSGNKVYAGSAYGGSLVAFDTETKQIEEYGQIRKRKDFVKAIVADEERDEIYVSIGSNMDLLVKKPGTKNFTSFLPAKYMSEKYAQDLVLTDDYVVARLYPSNVAVVFDRKTLKIVDEFELNSKTVSTLSPDGKSLYYTKAQQLIRYDFDTKAHTELGLYLPKGTEAINLDFIVKGEKKAEDKKVDFEALFEQAFREKALKESQGTSAVETPTTEDTVIEEPIVEEPTEFLLSGMVDNLGQLFEYNPQTGEIQYHQFELPEQPVELYTLASSEDGKKIFANGYMSGGLGVYDVATGNKELYRNISQIESMYHINNKLYIGAYPLARLLVYDRALPWDNGNPKEIIRMNEYGQERSTAVTPYNNGKEIVLGTLPDASVGGGALAFYNTENEKMEIYENYIYNQSIVSLVSRGTQVFGGTSIHANQQVNPRGARLFYFNRSNPEDKKYIHLPFDSSMITSLIVDKDNNVWGMADGTLFVYKDEWTDVRSVELLELISGRFRNAQIVEGPDGFIYGSVEGKLFRVTKDTLKVEWLKDKGVYGLVKDVNGNLYYYDGSNLWKYTIEQNREQQQKEQK
ncbi:hypothetical protein [Psychrobacillus lasiicapitis]|uniref:WD40 repeat domain-containing protein n=1 Tax=Psychrobacillus lasiicapitis TaxID=1636719 RepID=A0A544T2R5_9BACI|nr:hypothetical protein [Psychrobacillus lasiicapitis]TQR11701.1 hypothetical protein FG382_13865 [Psychrobacillus lasiicapitis]GGA18801.1 hypothetical protein GCM10011384_05020 [Psychrobacillus lasiicapitis]